MAVKIKGSELYQACLLAIALHKNKICAKDGRTAVLYQGSSRRGEIWRELEVRQQKFMQRMGFAAPYELLTDALRRESLPVQTGGKRVNLVDVLFPEDKRFMKGETEDIWDALSHHWARNNDSVFLYVGASKEPNTIFKEVELPMLRLKNVKSAELLAQIEKATRALEHKEKVGAELARIDDVLKTSFKTFAKELLERRKALSRLPLTDDGLNKLYDAVNKLSRLSH